MRSAANEEVAKVSWSPKKFLKLLIFKRVSVFHHSCDERIIPRFTLRSFHSGNRFPI